MAEQKTSQYHQILQVAPDAEPEVIAAAYRALAKKYHPDRSDAPDAMARMARLNVAYQSLRSRIPGRLSETDPASLQDTRGPVTQEHASPDATLEETLGIVHRKITAARQQITQELTRDGFARDVASSLVQQAFKEASGVRSDGRHRQEHKTTHIHENASYEEALRIATKRASVLRDEFADELARGGLQKSLTTELVDVAFERVRRRTEATSHQRLSSEHVDLSASLDKGVTVVGRKLKAARQMVMDELTRDGVPQKTAQQLVQSAAERIDWPGAQ
ncbi:MAG: DnaJ domain-containing protein [Chloroflexota bacterium]